MKFQDYMAVYLSKEKNTQKAFGALIGVTQAMIWSWIFEEKRISGEKVIPICEATHWQCSPHELRPDLYPHPHDGLPDDMRCACEDRAA